MDAPDLPGIALAECFSVLGNHAARRPVHGYLYDFGGSLRFGVLGGELEGFYYIVPQ